MSWPTTETLRALSAWTACAMVLVFAALSLQHAGTVLGQGSLNGLAAASTLYQQSGFSLRGGGDDCNLGRCGWNFPILQGALSIHPTGDLGTGKAVALASSPQLASGLALFSTSTYPTADAAYHSKEYTSGQSCFYGDNGYTCSSDAVVFPADPNDPNGKSCLMHIPGPGVPSGYSIANAPANPDSGQITYSGPPPTGVDAILFPDSGFSGLGGGGDGSYYVRYNPTTDTCETVQLSRTVVYSNTANPLGGSLVQGSDFTIRAGQQVTLEWSCVPGEGYATHGSYDHNFDYRYSDSAIIEAADGTPVLTGGSMTGSVDLTPTQTQTYTLTCHNAGGWPMYLEGCPGCGGYGAQPTTGPQTTQGITVNVIGGQLCDNSNSEDFGSQSFMAPGSYAWTAPPGVTQVEAYVIGAGGGSGGSFSSGDSAGGAGGGSGGAAEQLVAVTPGTTYTVIVGAGGQGGIHGGSVPGTGSDGADSSFGTLTVTGGRGGSFGGAGSYGGGGAGGSPYGGSGEDSTWYSCDARQGGQNGTAYGAGGSFPGGCNATGGAGAGGAVILHWAKQNTASCDCPNGLDKTKYPSCSCPSGTGQRGEICVGVCPAHSTGTPPNCECDPGYVMQNGQCVLLRVCPAHSTGTPPDCVCDPGYVMHNGQCVLLQLCPAHSSGTAPDCVCDPGYVMQNGQCVLLRVCPAHSTGTPPNCTCDSGYVMQNGQCIAVTVADFTANPARIPKNTSTPVTFTWSATGSAGCDVSGPEVDLRNVRSPQTESLQLDGSALYTLTCSGVQKTAVVDILPSIMEI